MPHILTWKCSKLQIQRRSCHPWCLPCRCTLSCCSRLLAWTWCWLLGTLHSWTAQWQRHRTALKFKLGRTLSTAENLSNRHRIVILLWEDYTLRVFMCTLTKFYPGWFFKCLGNISRIGEFLATALPSSAADEVTAERLMTSNVVAKNSLMWENLLEWLKYYPES